MIINKPLGINAIRAVSRIINNPLGPNTIMVVPKIISKLLEPNAITALSTVSNKPLTPSAIMTVTINVNKLQWNPTTTYLLNAITSSLSLVRHANDWGKSTSKFFCKSRYCKFWHRPSSSGSWDNVLQLRFSSVMWRVRCFKLQYNIKQHKLSISAFCGVLNNLVKTKWYITIITTFSLLILHWLLLHTYTKFHKKTVPLLFNLL